MNLEDIRRIYGSCKRCPNMWGGPVLFEGKEARICFVAEALGEHEVKLGRPLIGPSGQVFNRILTAAKISREDVFLMNTISCRPPSNEIQGIEIKNCAEIRSALIEACHPKVIVALGSVAMKALCPSNKTGIINSRGKILNYKGIPVVVTLHPSYVMRQEQELKGGDALGTRILNQLKWNVLSDFLTAKRIAEGEPSNGGGVPAGQR